MSLHSTEEIGMVERREYCTSISGEIYSYLDNVYLCASNTEFPAESIHCCFKCCSVRYICTYVCMYHNFLSIGSISLWFHALVFRPLPASNFFVQIVNALCISIHKIYEDPILLCLPSPLNKAHVYVWRVFSEFVENLLQESVA